MTSFSTYCVMATERIRDAIDSLQATSTGSSLDKSALSYLFRTVNFYRNALGREQRAIATNLLLMKGEIKTRAACAMVMKQVLLLEQSLEE